MDPGHLSFDFSPETETKGQQAHAKENIVYLHNQIIICVCIYITFHDNIIHK